MLKGNAYRLAVQTLAHLRRSKTTCALWIISGGVERTPVEDQIIAQMERKGAVLVGVVTGAMANADLAEAIITADADNEAVRRNLLHLRPL